MAGRTCQDDVESDCNSSCGKELSTIKVESDPEWEGSSSSSPDFSDDETVSAVTNRTTRGAVVYGHYVEEDGRLRLKPGTLDVWLTKVEWAKWQYEEASRRNLLRRQEQIADGSFNPDDPDGLLKKPKEPNLDDMTPKQVERYVQGKMIKEKNKHLIWWKKELLLLTVAKKLMQMIRSEMDNQSIAMCAELLKKIYRVQLTQNILMKNPAIVEVVNELQTFKVDTIRSMACSVFERFKRLFALQWGKPFMEEFFDQADVCREAMYKSIADYVAYALKENLVQENGKEIPAKYLTGEYELDILWDIGVYTRREKHDGEEEEWANNSEMDGGVVITSDYILDKSSDEITENDICSGLDNIDEGEIAMSSGDSDFLVTSSDEDVDQEEADDNEDDDNSGHENKDKKKDDENGSDDNSGNSHNNHSGGGSSEGPDRHEGYDGNSNGNDSGPLRHSQSGQVSKGPEEAEELTHSEKYCNRIPTSREQNHSKNKLTTELKTVKCIPMHPVNNASKRRCKTRLQSKKRKEKEVETNAVLTFDNEEEVVKSLAILDFIQSKVKFEKYCVKENPEILKTIWRACQSENLATRVLGLKIYSNLENILKDDHKEDVCIIDGIEITDLTKLYLNDNNTNEIDETLSINAEGNCYNSDSEILMLDDQADYTKKKELMESENKVAEEVEVDYNGYRDDVPTTEESETMHEEFAEEHVDEPTWLNMEDTCSQTSGVVVDMIYENDITDSLNDSLGVLESTCKVDATQVSSTASESSLQDSSQTYALDVRLMQEKDFIIQTKIADLSSDDTKTADISSHETISERQMLKNNDDISSHREKDHTNKEIDGMSNNFNQRAVFSTSKEEFDVKQVYQVPDERKKKNTSREAETLLLDVTKNIKEEVNPKPLHQVQDRRRTKNRSTKFKNPVLETTQIHQVQLGKKKKNRIRITELKTLLMDASQNIKDEIDLGRLHQVQDRSRRKSRSTRLKNPVMETTQNIKEEVNPKPPDQDQSEKKKSLDIKEVNPKPSDQDQSEKQKKKRSTKLGILVMDVTQNTTYNVGDMVWAKLGSYPYWPAMVCLDPHSLTYTSLKRNIPHIHVQFFEDTPTRGWVQKRLVAHHVKTFAKDFNEVPKFYSNNTKLLQAIYNADLARQLDLQERIRVVIYRIPLTDVSDVKDGKVQCQNSKITQSGSGKAADMSKLSPNLGKQSKVKMEYQQRNFEKDCSPTRKKAQSGSGKVTDVSKLSLNLVKQSKVKMEHQQRNFEKDCSPTRKKALIAKKQDDQFVTDREKRLLRRSAFRDEPCVHMNECGSNVDKKCVGKRSMVGVKVEKKRDVPNHGGTAELKIQSTLTRPQRNESLQSKKLVNKNKKRSPQPLHLRNTLRKANHYSKQNSSLKENVVDDSPSVRKSDQLLSNDVDMPEGLDCPIFNNNGKRKKIFVQPVTRSSTRSTGRNRINMNLRKRTM